MANRTYLYNTRALTNDPLAHGSGQPGETRACIEAAQASYRIPVAWLCMFRSQDLRPAVEGAAPCTSVQQALANLRGSWPLYEAIVREVPGSSPEESMYTARWAWEDAVAELEALPFPYLTLAVNEVVDADGSHERFVAALAGGPEAVEPIIELSNCKGLGLEDGLDAGFVGRFDAAGAPAPRPVPSDALVWQRRMRKLADGKTTSQQQTQWRKEALERMAQSANPVPIRFSLASELSAHAEYRLLDAEVDRARGQALDVAAVQQSFAARYTSDMVHLCRVLLLDDTSQQLQGLYLTHAAMGIVTGCEEPALLSARTLICLWDREELWMTRSVHAPDGFCARLIAMHLGLPVPSLKTYRPSEKHDALLSRDRCWGANDADFAALCLAACHEYTHVAPIGPFQSMPVSLLLLFKLRAMRGLGSPRPEHPLFTPAFGDLPSGLSVDAVADPLVARIRERLRAQGLDDASVHAAVTDAGAPAPRPAAPWWKFW